MKKGKIICLAFISVMVIFAITAFRVNAGNTKVESLMEEMTLRQKITQMMMVDFRNWDENLNDSIGAADFTEMNDQVKEVIETYHFGAVIYFADNIQKTEQSYQLTMDMQEAVIESGGIPMFIGADQEGGSVYRLGSGTALPGNMALGATGNKEYAYTAGSIVGKELSVLGINTNLAPVVDVNSNANNPVIGLRSYSDDAETVGIMASAFISGMREDNIIGCAKHFPGHGDTETDSHYGLPLVDKSKDVLMENELLPYKYIIADGADMIMTAHILYPQLDNSTIYSEKTKKQESLPATMSKKIVTDLLKNEMGFEGVVITDAMRMEAVSKYWNPVQAVLNAINAGVDMICMPCVLYDLDDLKDLDTIIEGVEKAVADGVVSEERINDAVERILKVKEKRGLLSYNSDEYSLEQALNTVGSETNREAEREIASAAVTVIKNSDDILPLTMKTDSKVLMMCPNDNERAQLVMGWNRAKNAGLIPDGAQMDYCRYSNAEITDKIKEKIDWADTLIILSEVSSSDKMAYKKWQSAAPQAFVNYAEEGGKKTIVMSADKPYDVQLYPKADAIMAVYGCKGSTADPTEEGITNSELAYGPNIIAGVEVALGVYGAKGKLPVDIPAYDSENNSYSEEIVYRRGYGITYHSLIENEIAEVETDSEIYFYDGTEKKPKVTVKDKSGEVLIENEHYQVQYDNNINAGIAQITVKGIGKYRGSVTREFTIEKATRNVSAILEKNCLAIGETTKISAIVSKGGGTITYEVKDEDVVNVDANGNITGVAGGETVVTIKVSETENYQTATETVKMIVIPCAPEITLKNVESTGKIKVTWKEVKGAEKYRVYRAASKGGVYKKVFTTTGLSYVNTSAKAGEKYYYKVCAIGNQDDVVSEFSSVKYRTCDLARPDITLKNLASTGKIKVTWKEVKGAEKYQVYRAASKDGVYKKVFTTTGLGYVNTSARAGEKYYYKVKAIHENSSANSAYSIKKYRVCDLARPAVKLDNTTKKKIRISWKAVNGANSYEIWRASSKNGTYKKIVKTSEKQYTDRKVTSGKTYYYKVKAIMKMNSSANSAYSKSVYKKVK